MKRSSSFITVLLAAGLGLAGGVVGALVHASLEFSPMEVIEWEERSFSGDTPYASEVHMIAVRSGPPAEAGQWFTERRNALEDFRRFHGRDLGTINVVAIMTDCDDTGQEAEAWYGTLRFMEE